VKIGSPLDRGTLLGLVIGAIVPGSLVTHTVVSRYKTGRAQLADEWTIRGERDLQVAPERAVLDFDTALSYAPERSANRLRLAEALIASKRPAEARAQLLTLWSEEPGNGRVNLELARLAAERGDLTNAMRYYHGAIDGSWESGATTARRSARLELSKYLLASHQPTRAQAELIALIDDLPPDTGLITEVGELLVTAGADGRALQLFNRALALDGRYGRAARLAGTVAYRTGNYLASRRYFETAERAGEPLDANEHRMHDVSARVLELDPFARGLNARTRAQRVLRALGLARDRLGRCRIPEPAPAMPPPAGAAPPGQPATPSAPAAGSPADVAARFTANTHVTQRVLERDADRLEEILGLVFEVERLPVSACGAPTIDDDALLILAAQHAARTQ
jgi:tetratricopeptide (TPR) repeat protein